MGIVSVGTKAVVDFVVANAVNKLTDQSQSNLSKAHNIISQLENSIAQGGILEIGSIKDLTSARVAGIGLAKEATAVINATLPKPYEVAVSGLLDGFSSAIGVGVDKGLGSTKVPKFVSDLTNFEDTLRLIKGGMEAGKDIASLMSSLEGMIDTVGNTMSVLGYGIKEENNHFSSYALSSLQDIALQKGLAEDITLKEKYQKIIAEKEIIIEEAKQAEQAARAKVEESQKAANDAQAAVVAAEEEKTRLEQQQAKINRDILDVQGELSNLAGDLADAGDLKTLEGALKKAKKSYRDNKSLRRMHSRSQKIYSDALKQLTGTIKVYEFVASNGETYTPDDIQTLKDRVQYYQDIIGPLLTEFEKSGGLKEQYDSAKERRNNLVELQTQQTSLNDQVTENETKKQTLIDQASNLVSNANQEKENADSSFAQAQQDLIDSQNQAQAAQDALKGAEDQIAQIINDNNQPPPATPSEPPAENRPAPTPVDSPAEGDTPVADSGDGSGLDFDGLPGIDPIAPPEIEPPVVVIPVNPDTVIDPGDQNDSIGTETAIRQTIFGYYMPTSAVQGSLTLLGDFRFESNGNNSYSGAGAIGNATAVGTPGYVTGVAGNALHFFGDSADAAANALKVSAANAYKPGTNGFIIEGFVKTLSPLNNAAQTTIRFLSMQGGDFEEGGVFGATSGRLTTTGLDPTTGSPVFFHYSDSAAFTDGTWSHVKYIVDRDSNVVRTIVDGKEVVNKAITFSGGIDPTLDMYIGAYNYINARNGHAAQVAVNGYLDNLRIVQGQTGNVEPLIIKVDNGTASSAEETFIKNWDGDWSGNGTEVKGNASSDVTTLPVNIQLNSAKSAISSVDQSSNSSAAMTVSASHYNGKNDIGISGTNTTVGANNGWYVTELTAIFGDGIIRRRFDYRCFVRCRP